jgi:hypothetical protein
MRQVLQNYHTGGAFYREIPCDATLFWGRLTWDKRVYESASRQ